MAVYAGACVACAQRRVRGCAWGDLCAACAWCGVLGCAGTCAACAWLPGDVCAACAWLPGDVCAACAQQRVLGCACEDVRTACVRRVRSGVWMAVHGPSFLQSLHVQKSDVDLMRTKLRRLEEENSRKDRQIEQLLDPSRVSSWRFRDGAWGGSSGHLPASPAVGYTEGRLHVSICLPQGTDFVRTLAEKRPEASWVSMGCAGQSLSLDASYRGQPQRGRPSL